MAEFAIGRTVDGTESGIPAVPSNLIVTPISIVSPLRTPSVLPLLAKNELPLLRKAPPTLPSLPIYVHSKQNED